MEAVAVTAGWGIQSLCSYIAIENSAVVLIYLSYTPKRSKWALFGFSMEETAVLFYFVAFELAFQSLFDCLLLLREAGEPIRFWMVNILQ